MPTSTLQLLVYVAGAFAVAGLLYALALARVSSRLVAAESELQRAHARIENLQRQVASLGAHVGWVDSRAHTRVLPAVVPLEALPSQRPPR